MGRIRLKRLEQHRTGGLGDNMELSIPLPKSPAGRYHRCCPTPGCVPNLFQIGERGDPSTPTAGGAVRREPGTAGCTCPYCGHDGADDDFVFRGDIQAARDYIRWAVAEDFSDHLGGVMDKLARDFNRKAGRGGFIKMTMQSKRGRRRPKPFVWREDLLRAMVCPTCRRDYGVYAIGLFCPDCGAPNVAAHFARELELVATQIEIAEGVEEERGRELSYRLLGNAHEDVLTAFEATLKTIYRFVVRRRFPAAESEEMCSKRRIGSAFQNVDRGSALFDALGVGLFDGLSDADIETLRANIQKRHVVGHNLSIVDDAYANAADASQPGETVTLVAAEIRHFAAICQRVVSRLEGELPELQPTDPAVTA